MTVFVGAGNGAGARTAEFTLDAPHPDLRAIAVACPSNAEHPAEIRLYQPSPGPPTTP